MRTTTLNRQSLLDVALQECGAFEAAFDLAERNDIALSDDLAAGRQLEYASEAVADKRTVASLAAYGARPATAVSPRDAAVVPWGGIGLMGIETDFIVS